jgi:hypothetical protein
MNRKEPIVSRQTHATHVLQEVSGQYIGVAKKVVGENYRKDMDWLQPWNGVVMEGPMCIMHQKLSPITMDPLSSLCLCMHPNNGVIVNYLIFEAMR